MNALFKHITSDRTIITGTITSLVIIFCIFLYVFITYPNLPPFLPIFNQLTWGDARIATKEYIFLPVSLSVIIFVINLILSFFIYNKIPLIARFLVITNFLVSFFMLLFIIRIIQLVK